MANNVVYGISLRLPV